MIVYVFFLQMHLHFPCRKETCFEHRLNQRMSVGTPNQPLTHLRFHTTHNRWRTKGICSPYWDMALGLIWPQTRLWPYRQGDTVPMPPSRSLSKAQRLWPSGTDAAVPVRRVLSHPRGRRSLSVDWFYIWFFNGGFRLAEPLHELVPVGTQPCMVPERSRGAT